jgi:hypothetical protein
MSTEDRPGWLAGGVKYEDEAEANAAAYRAGCESYLNLRTGRRVASVPPVQFDSRSSIHKRVPIGFCRSSVVATDQILAALRDPRRLS